MISAFRLSLFLLFQSTLPAGERHRHQNRCAIPICISIHAPRGGSDHQRRSNINPAAYFNPRSPRGERRQLPPSSGLQAEFQSTLPAGGATTVNVFGLFPGWLFQSTLPAGGATHRWSSLSRSATGKHFNPRSPRGERLATLQMAASGKSFQSTLPAGGSDTRLSRSIKPRAKFQSTLPAGGATSSRAFKSLSGRGFQSTLPAGGATFWWCLNNVAKGISIHAPRGGSDHA